MCGLTGALTFQDAPFKVTAPYVKRMLDTMAHRGPDGEGVWVSSDGRVGLGHRRLSIVDLSTAATQPMASNDRNLQLIFNGEIYNHAEIRRELDVLERKEWQTDHSDTEVIIRAFEQWGIDCVHRFRGMFAFALWDQRKRELWLVRDRIGIKPLYYSIHDGRLVFASEIKALLEDPQQQRSLDEEALFYYLSFATTPAPWTMFSGIKKLPAGTWMRVTADGRSETTKYWDVWDHARPLATSSEDEIAAMLVDELRTAVRYRKVSDVPVGVFLSGGIDSSTNAALFAEGETNPIKTFTIGYRGENQSYQNETHFARLMAGEVGADYHELLLEMDDMLSFLPRMVHLQDEPIADPVCVPLYYVSKLARDNGVIVCQVGEGADELFCGYPGWRRALQIENAGRLPGARWLFRNLASPLLRAGGVAERQSAQWLERVGRGKPAFWGGAELLSDAEKLRFLSPRLRKRFAECSAWDVLGPIHDRFKSAAWEASPLHWMSYLDLSIRLPELLLMRVDKMTMGTSLEARVPFLDHHFVTLAMSVPSELKTRNGVLKSLLKRSVRGLIPDVLIDRPKQGFGVPMHEWIMGRLGTEVRNAFHESTGDIFDIPAVTGLVDSGEARKSWSIYNFVAWQRAFLTPPATVG